MAIFGIRGVTPTPEEAKIIWQRICSPRNKEWFLASFLCCFVLLVLLFPPGGFGEDGIGFATNKKTADVVSECCIYLSFVTMGCASGFVNFSTPSNDMEIQWVVKVVLYFLIVGFALLRGALVAMLW